MNFTSVASFRKLRIAVLAPVAWRCPPRHYGPWEQIAWSTAEGLYEAGHEVTLFATGDSITQAKLDAVCPKSWEEDKSIDPKVAECLHISNLMSKANQFDIIHNHFDFLPLTYARLIRTPMVTTIHGFSSPKIVTVYENCASFSHYISISNSNRHPTLPYMATVYNGIEVCNFPFFGNPDSYALFFGRIHPEKGLLEAIKICEIAKIPLNAAGIIQDTGYFENKIKPYITRGSVRYLGHIGPDTKAALLGNAYCLLHPISFDEPFGLSVAEAMCCGTPVIAFNRGSMPELIVNGEIGFLVHTVSEAANAVKKIHVINRIECRNHVLCNFSRERMIKGYLEVYQRILKNKYPA